MSALILLSGMLTTSCGGLLAGLTGSESDTAYLNSAFSFVTQALNLKEAVQPFSARAIRPQSGACTTPAGITASGCSSNSQTYTYNDCSGQLTGAIYSGALGLAFSDSCTLALADSHSVLVTTSNFTTTSADTTVIMWSSATHQNYLGTSYSGGYRITNQGSYNELLPIALHRQKSSSVGTSIFDHTIRPANDAIPTLQIDEGFALGQRLVTGFITVDSNSLGFTASIQMAGVIFGSATCGHPTHGTVDVKFGGSKSGEQHFTFLDEPCGSIKDVATGVSYTLDPAF